MDITLLPLVVLVCFHDATYGCRNVFGNRESIFEGNFLPVEKSEIVTLLNEVYEVCLKDTVLYWILMQNKLFFDLFQCLCGVNGEIDVKLYLFAKRKQLVHVLSHQGQLKFHLRFIDIEAIQFYLLEVAFLFELLYLFWSLQINFESYSQIAIIFLS